MILLELLSISLDQSIITPVTAIVQSNKSNNDAWMQKLKTFKHIKNWFITIIISSEVAEFTFNIFPEQKSLCCIATV